MNYIEPSRKEIDFKSIENNINLLNIIGNPKIVDFLDLNNPFLSTIKNNKDEYEKTISYIKKNVPPLKFNFDRNARYRLLIKNLAKKKNKKPITKYNKNKTKFTRSLNYIKKICNIKANKDIYRIKEFKSFKNIASKCKNNCNNNNNSNKKYEIISIPYVKLSKKLDFYSNEDFIRKFKYYYYKDKNYFIDKKKLFTYKYDGIIPYNKGFSKKMKKCFLLSNSNNSKLNKEYNLNNANINKNNNNNLYNNKKDNTESELDSNFIYTNRSKCISNNKFYKENLITDKNNNDINKIDQLKSDNDNTIKSRRITFNKILLNDINCNIKKKENDIVLNNTIETKESYSKLDTTKKLHLSTNRSINKNFYSNKNINKNKLNKDNNYNNLSKKTLYTNDEYLGNHKANFRKSFDRKEYIKVMSKKSFHYIKSSLKSNQKLKNYKYIVTCSDSDSYDIGNIIENNKLKYNILNNASDLIDITNDKNNLVSSRSKIKAQISKKEKLNKLLVDINTYNTINQDRISTLETYNNNNNNVSNNKLSSMINETTANSMFLVNTANKHKRNPRKNKSKLLVANKIRKNNKEDICVNYINTNNIVINTNNNETINNNLTQALFIDSNNLKLNSYRKSINQINDEVISNSNNNINNIIVSNKNKNKNSISTKSIIKQTKNNYNCSDKDIKITNTNLKDVLNISKTKSKSNSKLNTFFKTSIDTYKDHFNTNRFISNLEYISDKFNNSCKSINNKNLYLNKKKFLSKNNIEKSVKHLKNINKIIEKTKNFNNINAMEANIKKQYYIEDKYIRDSNVIKNFNNKNNTTSKSIYCNDNNANNNSLNNKIDDINYFNSLVKSSNNKLIFQDFNTSSNMKNKLYLTANKAFIDKSSKFSKAIKENTINLLCNNSLKCTINNTFDIVNNSTKHNKSINNLKNKFIIHDNNKLLNYEDEYKVKYNYLDNTNIYYKESSKNKLENKNFNKNYKSNNDNNNKKLDFMIKNDLRLPIHMYKKKADNNRFNISKEIITENALKFVKNIKELKY